MCIAATIVLILTYEGGVLMEYYEKHQKPAQQKAQAAQPKTERRTEKDLKTRFENMSGYSFGDVRIHYHSDKPMQVGAAAYTMGHDVYLGTGQEKYLGHELGHVLQQKRTQIPPNIQYKGIAINNDPGLEREADMLAAHAMEFPTTPPHFGEHKKTSAPDNSKSIAQMAKWRWSARTKNWNYVSGTVVSGSPTRSGRYDGEIYDDTPAPTVEVRTIKPPQKQETPLIDTTYTGDDEQYRESMIALRDAWRKGEELDEKQRKQVESYFSNAGFLFRILQHMRQKPEDIPLREEWQDALAAFEESAEHSVFTRDIDSNELLGQPTSGGTMSVLERMMRAWGRIRNYRDLNRGGGAGSYVRFISENKLPTEDSESSKTLDVGGLASAGITILYDAIAVVRDNSAPAHLAFNKQDSAGRIFGTDASTWEELRRNSRMSQRLLTEANPDNPFHSPTPHAQSLSFEYIMKNAIRGLEELTRQAREGQSAKEEYNETILFAGAKISNIKAILIHTPIAPGGRPPIKIEYTDRQKKRQQKRRLAYQQEKTNEQSEIQTQIHEIDTDLASLRGSSRRDSTNLELIINLESEKTILIARWHELELELHRAPKVKKVAYRLPRTVSTSLPIRSPYLYEKGHLPPELWPWYNETGYGGVPIKYLFYHINPGNITRAKLPQLADEVWKKGQSKWQEDIRREKELETMRRHDAEDVANLRVTGTALFPSPSACSAKTP